MQTHKVKFMDPSHMTPVNFKIVSGWDTSKTLLALVEILDSHTCNIYSTINKCYFYNIPAILNT